MLQQQYWCFVKFKPKVDGRTLNITLPLLKSAV